MGVEIHMQCQGSLLVGPARTSLLLRAGIALPHAPSPSNLLPRNVCSLLLTTSQPPQVSCKSCSKNFCFKHRHEDDHKCEVTKVQQLRGGGGAARTTAKVTPSRRPTVTSSAGTVSAGRNCGVEARVAASRRAAAAEGRAAAASAKPVTDVTAH